MSCNLTSGRKDVDKSAVAAAVAGADYLSKTEVLVEAVFEDLGTKHKVLEEVERPLPEHAMFATNTSTISIADIEKGA